MANTNLSANMNLPIPVPGVQSGPQYAININDCLTLLDQHNHTPGFGAPIVAAALDINDDLPINDHNITLTRTVRFSSQNAALVLASDLRCIYVIDQDLYFNDGSGNLVRITQFGNVAGTPGSIANLVSPASASYVSGSTKFVFQSDVNTAANIDAGSILLRNLTASSFALTLSPPTLSSNYSVTLPALPAASKILTMDSSGAMSAVTDTDNSTIEIASNLLRVKAAGITTAQMAPGAVILKSQTFAASANFTVPAGVTDVIVHGCGGGGGGSSGPRLGGNSSSGGGGAGAQSNMYACSVTPAAVLAVVVGTGGAGGAAVSGVAAGNNGAAGGTSSFNGLSFKGGAGGTAAPSVAAAGAGGAGAIYSVAGGSGSNGSGGGAGTAGAEGWNYSGGSGSAIGSGIGGAGGGGAGHGGNGGAASQSGGASSAAGQDGQGLGAGGGASAGVNSNLGAGSSGKGGDGYRGFVTIYWVDRA